METIRVGLVGAGGIAPAHAMAVRSLPATRLVGVADIDRARAHALAERHGADGAYGSLDELMAAARPDVVHILLPPELHARVAIEAMAAGAHVLVEKPLCLSLDECRALTDAATAFGRVVAVNHNVTFDSTFLRLVDAIRARRIGALQHVSVYWAVPFGDHVYGTPLGAAHGSGAVLWETAPHPLSLAVRLVGEARAATALVTSELGRAADTWQLALACARGTAHCFVGIARPFTETRVRAIGEDGVVDADLRLGNVTVTAHTRHSPLFFRAADTLALAGSLATSAARNFAALVRRIPAGGATDGILPLMRASIGDFYAALRRGAAPAASLREGVAVVRTCLRAIDAAATSAAPSEVTSWPGATASS